jgi:hypothetical protein
MNKPIYCKNSDCAEYSRNPDSLCDDCNIDNLSDILEPYIVGYKTRKKNRIMEKSVNTLKSTIQMKKTKNTIYLTEDNNVEKYIITKGNDTYPEIGQIVKVHYTGSLLDNTKFDSSLDRNQEFEFKLGEENIIELWNIALPTMCKGEKAVITGSSKYCYRDLDMPKIPPNSTLKFTIELLDFFDAPKTMEELTTEEKTTFLNDYKTLGKNAFLNNDLQSAIKHYTTAQSYAENLDSEEKINIYNNLSLITYRLKDYVNSLHYADLAYNIENKNTKTLFRLATANFNLSNYDTTIQSCNELLSFDNNIEIRKLLKECKHKKKLEHEKSKTMYQKMFK